LLSANPKRISYAFVRPVATIGAGGRDPNLLDHQAKMATREQGGHPLVSCCETFSRLWLPAALPQIQ
jgi:hypothetical protein